MGSGYRVFTAGEVLSASNVQNYLQDQAVMVFGGTAARSSAIGTANFEEGMLTYLTDVDKLQVYTGAAFVDVYPAVATNQGLTLINTTSFSGVNTQSINDVFSTTYQNYRVLLNISSHSGNGGITARLRVSGADANTNYFAYSYHTRTNLGAIGADSGNPTTFFWVGYANTNFQSAGSYDLFSPFETRPTLGVTQFMGGDTSTYFGSQGAFLNSNSTSYTGLTILAAGANTITGTVRVYGYNQ